MAEMSPFQTQHELHHTHTEPQAGACKPAARTGDSPCYATCSAAWLQRALSVPERWRWTQHLRDIIQHNCSAAHSSGCSSDIVLRHFFSLLFLSNISDASLSPVELTWYVLGNREWPSMIRGRTWVKQSKRMTPWSSTMMIAYMF